MCACPSGRTAVLVSALYVATAIAQPTAGKVAEVFGPRRVLIGLGTSCAYPTAMLLIRGRADAAGMEKPPGGVLGGLQIAGIPTASLGLPIGGVLVELLGWRAVFFINVLVAVIALVATMLWIPADTRRTGRRGARAVASALDLTGILGFAAAMTLLLFFLSSLPKINLVYLVATVVLWVALVIWERRAKTPFFDVRLLASNLALTRTYVRFAVVMLCGYVVLYGITQWLEAARGMSELDAGLLLLPMTLVSGITVIPISRRNLIRGPVSV